MNEEKQYWIEKITDVLSVPQGRRKVCLTEPGGIFDTIPDPAVELMAGCQPVVAINGMMWVDDGRTDLDFVVNVVKDKSELITG